METGRAFAMGAASKNNRVKVFDWHKAAKLIKEKKPKTASAGLSGDWEYTGGTIYRDKAPVAKENTYTYLASTWAIPELDLDGKIIDCWIWIDESDDWNASTYWPQSALDILNSIEA